MADHLHAALIKRWRKGEQTEEVYKSLKWNAAKMGITMLLAQYVRKCEQCKRWTWEGNKCCDKNI